MVLLVLVVMVLMVLMFDHNGGDYGDDGAGSIGFHYEGDNVIGDGGDDKCSHPLYLQDLTKYLQLKSLKDSTETLEHIISLLVDLTRIEPSAVEEFDTSGIRFEMLISFSNINISIATCNAT